MMYIKRSKLYTNTALLLINSCLLFYSISLLSDTVTYVVFIGEPVVILCLFATELVILFRAARKMTFLNAGRILSRFAVFSFLSNLNFRKHVRIGNHESSCFIGCLVKVFANLIMALLAIVSIFVKIRYIFSEKHKYSYIGNIAVAIQLFLSILELAKPSADTFSMCISLYFPSQKAAKDEIEYELSDLTREKVLMIGFCDIDFSDLFLTNCTSTDEYCCLKHVIHSLPIAFAISIIIAYFYFS